MFSRIDLRSGVLKVAFRTKYRYYGFLIVLFGLTNVLVAFINSKNQVSDYYHDEFVIVFIGDIFLFSKGYEQLEQYLKLVLQQLKHEKLRAKSGKCSPA